MRAGCILISAYACETGRGGEGEIAWRIVHELAAVHDVIVITRANLKDTHAASFAVSPQPMGLSFEYYDLPWIFRFYKKGKRSGHIRTKEREDHHPMCPRLHPICNLT